MSVRNLLLIASCSTTLTLAFSPALADEGLVCDGRNFDLLNPDFYNEPLGFNKIDDVGDEVQYSDDLGKAYAQAMVNESMPFDFDCGLPECYEDGFLPESTVLPVDEPIVVEEPETSPTPPENPPPSTPSTPASSPEVSSVSSSDLPHPSTDVTPVVDNKGDEGDCGDDKGDKHSYKRDTQGLSKHTSVKRLWSRSTDIEQRTIPHSTFAGVFVPFERSNQSLTERNRVGNFNDDLEGVIPRWKRGTVLKFSVRVCQCPKGRGSDLVVAMNRAVGTWAQVNSVIRVSKGGRQYYETRNLIGFDAVPEKSTLPIDFLVRCNPTQKLNPNNGRNVNAEAFFPNDRTKDTIEVYPAAFASNSVEKLSIILQHELGHILGLAHEVLNADRSVAFPDQSANKFSVMGQETKRSTNLLDTAAVRKLYGLDEGKVISGHVVKAYASRRSKAPKDFAAGDFAKDQCKPPPPPSERNCRVVTQRVCN